MQSEIDNSTGNKPAGPGGFRPPALSLPGGRPVKPWLVLASLMFGFFMSLLDATIVNIAIADIQTSLKTDLTTVSWVLNAYSLVFAVLLVTMGRFADQYGRKLMFMTGMVLFSLGSLLCALAPTIEWLIAFRAVQAIGAAALNPISLAIITVVFPPHKRGAAIGIWGAAAGLAAAAGPVLGGVLVQNFRWNSIFYVNLPFCLVGLFMVYRFVPENKDLNANKKIDFLGLITITAGLFCLVLAIMQGNDWGWTSGGILGLAAGAVAGLLLFAFVESRQAQPIVDFGLFRFRSFTATNLTMFMFSIGIQGAFLILVLYFINAQGYSELNAAYAILPIPLASFVVSAALSRLHVKVNSRFMGILGMLLVAAGLGMYATIGPDAGWLDTAWRSTIIGLGMGICFITFPSMVLLDVPHSKVGVGSGVFNTFRQVGFTLGVAILISLFTGQIKDDVAAARSRAVEIIRADQNLPEAVRSNIAAGLQNSASQAPAGNSRGGVATQQFDLTTLADRIPGGQALKPELANLNNRIAAEFRTGVNESFTTTWLVAALISLAGVVPAFFTRAHRKDERSESMIAEAA